MVDPGSRGGCWNDSYPTTSRHLSSMRRWIRLMLNSPPELRTCREHGRRRCWSSLEVMTPRWRSTMTCWRSGSPPLGCSLFSVTDLKSGYNQFLLPTSKLDVQRLLCITNFYCRFPPRLAHIVRPMTDSLATTKRKFTVTEDMLRSLTTVKNLISNACMLSTPSGTPCS